MDGRLFGSVGTADIAEAHDASRASTAEARQVRLPHRSAQADRRVRGLGQLCTPRSIAASPSRWSRSRLNRTSPQVGRGAVWRTEAAGQAAGQSGRPLHRLTGSATDCHRSPIRAVRAGPVPTSRWPRDAARCRRTRSRPSRRVLGGLLLDNQAWDRVADLLTDGDFYRYEHRLIYRAIAALAERAASRPT
ncbi:MAG: hypothetical protein MZV65_14555 [Chromatiales bacterium]|nr:hypothetical protein [Chromatiales bacterium]